jgi:WD40-like Beta Propeller Repeat
MECTNSRRSVCAAAAVWLTLLTATPSSAQYFGRNKVQFKKLNFQILKTEHFDIYFYPEEREGIDVAARMAERWHARLERLFEHTLRGRQPLVLYASHPDFEQTNTIQGELGEGTGGVTEPLRRRIVLPMGGPLADTDHVIGHELVHAFQFDITTSPNSPPGETGVSRLPLWFTEGMAEYLSLGAVDPNTTMWLRDAVRQNKLPAVDDLDNPKYFPYRWGQAFWAYVGGRFGDDVVPRMLAIGAAAGDPAVAVDKVLGMTTKELSNDWHEAIRQASEPVIAASTPPTEVGTVVIEGRKLGEDLNVGPAISPDGRWIAFLSTRSVFSTDLFVADASTRKIVHRLTSTATDPHYSSLQFIYSAGAWDAASERIAIATVVSGRPALAIFTAADGRKQREVRLPELDEVFNPTWAPDGHAVCFTAMTRGLTDLYVYDFAASKLRRLTNDAYAELQPAWSPDGSRIAFATDRFTSDLARLNIGAYRLALIDPESGRIEPLPAATSGKNINPQWAPDGRALFFISDADGIPNLYRVAIGSGDIAQVTRISTGLSGITASSPALSVAARTGVAAFSVYQDGKYDIHTLDTQASGSRGPGASGRPGAAGRPAEAGTGRPAGGGAEPTAAVLPPADRRPSEVERILDDPAFGLPAPDNYEVASYKPALSLEGMAQPSIGIGADRFGAAIGGGLAFQFGDMLGEHTLITALQLNSGFSSNFSLKNTAAQAAYFNQAHRWNWGVIGGQIPYLTGGFESTLGSLSNGEPVQINRAIIFRQTEQSVAGMAAYPFNRAQRVEFQAGVTRMSFDQVVETQAFSLRNGQLLVDDSEDTPFASPLTLGTSSAALVYDTSNFGATSPVHGQRYRLEVAPAFGAINFTSALADYRRYFMPAPFYTIAVRAMHYGRYGSGGQDPRLFPLFIGYQNLVRGYDVVTFDSQDCVPTPASSCPALDRMVGSRTLVGNLELRFPLLRPFGASQRMYGPIPVEVALFTDGGVAWDRGEKPSFLGGSRDGVGSAGIALRVNLLGFAIGEFDFARAFQRPARTASGVSPRMGRWVFQFNLSPGF